MARLFQMSLLPALALVLRARAQCVGPEVNQTGLDLIKEFESFEPDICEY